MRFIIGALATVVLGMVVAKQNETAGGAVFLLGIALALAWQVTGGRSR